MIRSKSTPIVVQILILVKLIGLVSTAYAQSGEPDVVLRHWMDKARSINSLAATFDELRFLDKKMAPIVSHGELWMSKQKLFRWQLGNPPTTIAIREPDGRFCFIDAKHRKAKVWAREAMEVLHFSPRNESTSEKGFRSVEEFYQHFRLKSVVEDSREPHVFNIELELRDRWASIFILRVNATICLADGFLRGFVVFMRDGSRYEMRVNTIQLNPKLEDQLFKFDLSSYQIESMNGR